VRVRFFACLILKMFKYRESLFKTVSVLLLFLFPLVLFSCASPEQYNSGEPEALLDDIRVWDFGRVKEGEVLEHSFILRNSQDKPLFISFMATSCGCTVSQTPKKNLSPGEYTPINVKFHTQGYSGLVQQHVYVHTDNPSAPVIKFSVKAEVVK